MSPARSASSRGPKFLLTVGSNTQLNVPARGGGRRRETGAAGGRGDEPGTGQGQHQQQGKPGPKEWILGAPEGGHNMITMKKMGRE